MRDRILELVPRYRKLYAGVVYDAVYYDVGHRERFVIDREIGLQLYDVRMPAVGPAFTCWGTRASTFTESADVFDKRDAARLAIFEAMQPGDVVMMDTDQDTTVAHFGDITATICHQRGVAGVVIDGYTRDVGRIGVSELGVPVFARGCQPQDAYGKWALQKHGEPVLFNTSGGNRVTVRPGDLIFADYDGVMAIPAQIAIDAVPFAEERAAKEAEIREALRTRPLREVYEKLGRW